MKLQARKSVARKPKTVDITAFFKKFCIATRTIRKVLVFKETGTFFLLSSAKSSILQKAERVIFPSIYQQFINKLNSKRLLRAKVK